MFGFFLPNARAMTKDERETYRSYYCGLCRAIGKRHGQLPRLALSYEMTFLALLLSSLEGSGEAEGETETRFFCPVHPLGLKDARENRFLDYAADLSVLLAYAKAEDDKNDDGSLSARLFASRLSSENEKAKEEHNAECEALAVCLSSLSEAEKRDERTPDLPASLFGDFCGILFSSPLDPIKEKETAEKLAQFGFLLGKFLYLMDAAVDLKRDLKKGSYNPLVSYPTSLRRQMLEGLMDEAMELFETLPIVKNKKILENILYSGVWTKYNLTYRAKKNAKEQI